jgi:hypothetical protein
MDGLFSYSWMTTTEKKNTKGDAKNTQVTKTSSYLFEFIKGELQVKHFANTREGMSTKDKDEIIGDVELEWGLTCSEFQEIYHDVVCDFDLDFDFTPV